MKNLSIILLLSFLSLNVISCVKNTTHGVTPITPTDTNYCELGCQHLQTLTGKDGKPVCEEARPLHLPNGNTVSCTQFCIETQNAGRNLYPSCWVEVKNCSEIETFRLQSKPCK